MIYNMRSKHFIYIYISMDCKCIRNDSTLWYVFQRIMGMYIECGILYVSDGKTKTIYIILFHIVYTTI